MQRHPVARLGIGTFVPVPPNPSFSIPTCRSASPPTWREEQPATSPLLSPPPPLSLSPRSLVPRVLTDGFEWFRMVVWAVWDGVHLILGTVRNAPTHRNKPESRRITGDVVRVIYIGGTYAWPGFVCRSVRPSVRRFANAQPGCPVSADDRSHHRVLTAGPASRWGKSAVRHY